MRTALAQVEKAVGRKFGDPKNPLLVSVRSGARVSMPGMMDTVLNLGLNDDTVEGLAAAAHDPRFAWDSYRRFVQMYGSVVLGVDHHRFEEIIEHAKLDARVTEDTALTAQDWQRVVDAYKEMVAQDTGKPFPQDPNEQLWGAIGAVFGSMDEPSRHHLSPAARHPRRVGHRGERAGHGLRQHGRRLRHRRVLHPRPVHRREHVLRRIPGERAGRGRGGRHPHAAAGVQDAAPSRARRRWKQVMPEAYAELMRVRETLEQHYHDMQDLEFTVQQKKLYMLQTRNGKRTTAASLRMAVDMAREGLIDQDEAVRRVNPSSLDQLLHPTLDPKAPRTLLGKGLPASPGAASGAVVFNADEAESRAAEGRGGDPGARRNQPRGYPRHARRPRHPDHARRHDQPRRGGGARHGPALRGRRRRHRGGLQRADAVGRPARRCAPARSSRSTAPPARCSSAPWR